jgi:nucleoside phosphorylase
VLLVGIAGGVGAAGVRIGDVIVPDQIAGYEPGKMGPDGVRRRPEAYRPDFDLLTVAQSTRAEEWVPQIGAARPGSAGEPAVHFGTVLSGEKVIADAAVLDGLRAEWPKAVGVEMESFGVALAAYRFGGRFLMVKGVSDLADAGKDDRWREYAAEAAARFAVAVLHRLPAADPGRMPDLSVPGPVVVQVCRRLVRDWLELARYFEIPEHTRAGFRAGDEPAMIWEWLVARRRLRELPAALVFLGREDLAEELLRVG